jgi:hypothetical protein
MTRSDTAAYPPRGMSRDEAARYNLADGEFWTTPPLRCSVVLIRRSVVVFLDLTAPKSNFRFTPESGLRADIAPCPSCANKRH